MLRKPFGQLKRFRREGIEDSPRLLIVAPMSGHYATLLRGTVERLMLVRGYIVLALVYQAQADHDAALHADADPRRVTVLTDDERPFVIYGEKEGK